MEIRIHLLYIALGYAPLIYGRVESAQGKINEKQVLYGGWFKGLGTFIADSNREPTWVTKIWSLKIAKNKSASRQVYGNH